MSWQGGQGGGASCSSYLTDSSGIQLLLGTLHTNLIAAAAAAMASTSRKGGTAERANQSARAARQEAANDFSATHWWLS